MSTRGQWKTADGRVIQISSMDDNHLRNSMRMMYRRIMEYTSADPVRTAPPFYTDKLSDLGEEAQRRNWLPPGDVDFSLLLQTVGEWEAEAQRNRPAPRPIVTDGNEVFRRVRDRIREGRFLTTPDPDIQVTLVDLREATVDDDADPESTPRQVPQVQPTVEEGPTDRNISFDL